MRYLLTLIFVFSGTVQAASDETASSPAPVAVEKAVDTRTEAEIPLNFEAKKNAASESSGVFRILFTLSLLGLVGTGAFVFLRKYSIPKEKKHQTQIKVLQQHYLGPKKSLAIVRVAGESILIGVTDHNISMIKSLSLLDDEIPAEAPQNFHRVLQNETSQTEKENLTQKAAKTLDPDEEFAISGIKDIVSKRLKGMRSLQ